MPPYCAAPLVDEGRRARPVEDREHLGPGDASASSGIDPAAGQVGELAVEAQQFADEVPLHLGLGHVRDPTPTKDRFSFSFDGYDPSPESHFASMQSTLPLGVRSTRSGFTLNAHLNTHARRNSSSSPIIGSNFATLQLPGDWR